MIYCELQESYFHFILDKNIRLRNFFIRILKSFGSYIFSDRIDIRCTSDINMDSVVKTKFSEESNLRKKNVTGRSIYMGYRKKGYVHKTSVS